MTDQPTEFDGCNSECRKAGKHSLRWGGCEHATPPEPTVSMSVVYTDPADGYPAIGFDTYTVPQLAELIEPALNATALRAWRKPSEVAAEVARAIVHRHDEERAVVPVSSPPPDQTAVEERVARRLAGAWISEEDWQRRPANFRAEYLAYARDVLAFVPHPEPDDRAAVLREEADRIDATRAQFPIAVQNGITWATAEMRRHAAECPQCGTTGACNGGPCPLRRLAAEAQQPECTASVSGDCLSEAESETACDTEAGECVHGGRPGAEAQQPDTETRTSWTPGPVALARAADWATKRQDATVDPAMCPRCKGDNSEAFQLCAACATPEPPAHIGGNADDCPACQAQGLHTIGHPYECPGPETTAGSDRTD